DPERLQIMYSITGDRNLMERELEHLPGYEDSAPVRVGNGAAAQFQADVVGEVMIALAMMREAGVEETRWSWPLQKALVRFTIDRLDEPDQGIWEMRGDPAYFTHGRVMVWAVFDRAIDAVRRHGLPARDGEVENWERLREQVREEVLTRGGWPEGSATTAPSARPTAPPRSTPRCCRSRTPVSCLRTIRGCSPPWPGSSRTCTSRAG